MPEPMAYAGLIVAEIVYLGGAVLVIAALAKVLVAWSDGRRTGRAAEPVTSGTAETIVGAPRI